MAAACCRLQPSAAGNRPSSAQSKKASRHLPWSRSKNSSPRHIRPESGLFSRNRLAPVRGELRPWRSHGTNRGGNSPARVKENGELPDHSPRYAAAGPHAIRRGGRLLRRHASLRRWRRCGRPFVANPRITRSLQSCSVSATGCTSATASCSAAQPPVPCNSPILQEAAHD